MIYVLAILVLFGYGVTNFEYTKTCETAEVTNNEGEVVRTERSCNYSFDRVKEGDSRE